MRVVPVRVVPVVTPPAAQPALALEQLAHQTPIVLVHAEPAAVVEELILGHAQAAGIERRPIAPDEIVDRLLSPANVLRVNLLIVSYHKNLVSH